MEKVTVTANDGRKVAITAAQAQAIKTLNETRKGGCAAVEGYVPTTNWVEPPVQDIQMITHFSTEKLYKRRIEALKGIKFEDIADKLANDEKLSAIPTMKEARSIFDDRKEKMIASLEKTLEGDRSDAHRKGHDRCYAHRS